MLSFSRKTDYALVALAYLGQKRLAGQPVVSARQIAEQFKLPVPLLMNILKDLAHCGIIDSTRGAHGGYQLLADPSEVTLLDVVDAIEGPARLAPCCVDDTAIAEVGCEIAPVCPVHQPIRQLNQRLLDFLREVTLADFALGGGQAPSLVSIGIEGKWGDSHLDQGNAYGS